MHPFAQHFYSIVDGAISSAADCRRQRGAWPDQNERGPSALLAAAVLSGRVNAFGYLDGVPRARQRKRKHSSTRSGWAAL
ncbi:MAG: hypothetical protein DMG64_10580 [Acidobacteria bacterium]|nr:MAG: hypothetical protein DMG64_10580 [Acidobacteriota bacterium]